MEGGGESEYDTYEGLVWSWDGVFVTAAWHGLFGVRYADDGERRMDLYLFFRCLRRGWE